jgi:threonine dehydrogenase-like Zn-dependent dehydrogenase
MLERVRPARLITHRMPFIQAPHAYMLLDRYPQEAMQVLLTYER